MMNDFTRNYDKSKKKLRICEIIFDSHNAYICITEGLAVGCWNR